jgi:hypothetical protein
MKNLIRFRCNSQGLKFKSMSQMLLSPKLLKPCLNYR